MTNKKMLLLIVLSQLILLSSCTSKYSFTAGNNLINFSLDHEGFNHLEIKIENLTNQEISLPAPIFQTIALSLYNAKGEKVKTQDEEMGRISCLGPLHLVQIPEKGFAIFRGSFWMFTDIDIRPLEKNIGYTVKVRYTNPYTRDGSKYLIQGEFKTVFEPHNCFNHEFTVNTFDKKGNLVKAMFFDYENNKLVEY